MSILPRTIVAATLVALFAAAAHASPAITRGSTKVFDGPSTRFAVVTVLRPETDIEVIGCSRGWCQVDLEDQEGFVRERALDFDEDEPAVIIFPPVVYRYGWNYWRYYYRGDWEDWRGRYGLRSRPYVAPQIPPPGPRPSQPNMVPPIQRPMQPDFAPPSSRQGPPSTGPGLPQRNDGPSAPQRPMQPDFALPSSRQGPPSTGPGLPQRNDGPSAPQRQQDLGQQPPPGGMAPPPGGLPPRPGGMPLPGQ